MAEDPRYRPPSEESMLLDLVQRLERLRAGRTGVHIHLSRLSEAYNQERYRRIATDSFSSFAAGFEGHLFKLSNGDLFFIAKDITLTALEAAVERVKRLFSQDPILESYTIKGTSKFCTWYYIEKDYDELLDTVRIIAKEAEINKSFLASLAAEASRRAAPIGPERLNRLEQALETVDVTNITRRQSVCTLIDDNKPQPLFEEIFISITDLQTIVAPDVDISGNTWLFRYLSQTLDHRIMLMLIRDGVSSSRPFSLNLTIDTILTPEFAKFEAAIAPQLRGRLVIELNHLDVFSDMGAFLFARDYLHDHGFRLCLDGLTHHTLPYCNRDRLGFDLIKLNWAPSGLDDMLPSMLPEVKNLIMETGQAHAILARCETDEAIRLGHELGIVMFQGRQVDRLLHAPRTEPPITY